MSRRGLKPARSETKLHYTVLEYDKVLHAVQNFRIDIAHNLEFHEQHGVCSTSLKKLFKQTMSTETRLRNSGRHVSLTQIQKSIVSHAMEKYWSEK